VRISTLVYSSEEVIHSKKFLLLRPENVGAKAKNGGLRQVKKTSLSKEDLSIPGRDMEGE
jgi:hypothetical protein